MKKPKINNKSEKKKNKKLEKDIAFSEKEIQPPKKSEAETTKTPEKEKNVKIKDQNKALDGILSFGFEILNGSIMTNDKKGNGLLSLVNDLGTLAEKSKGKYTMQKTISFGKGGAVDFRLSSRPIKASSTTQPSNNGIKIRKPLKQSPRANIILPQSVGTIKERDPIVDIFEEGDYLRVTTELPCVKENEIELRAEGKSLKINLSTLTKAYCKKIDLPTIVEKEIVESSYHNGILEIKLKKRITENQA